MAGNRTNGILGISANFEPQKAAAFDARCNVPQKSDLYIPATWVANDGGTYTYIGMTVTVADDKASDSNNGIYILTGTDIAVPANWKFVGSGAYQEGAGITIDATTTPDTVAVEYVGATNVIDSASQISPTLDLDTNYIIYSDSNTNNVYRRKINEFLQLRSPYAIFSINNAVVTNSFYIANLGTITVTAQSTSQHLVSWTTAVASGANYMVNINVEDGSPSTTSHINVISKTTTSFILKGENSYVITSDQINIVMYD